LYLLPPYFHRINIEGAVRTLEIVVLLDGVDYKERRTIGGVGNFSFCPAVLTLPRLAER